MDPAQEQAMRTAFAEVYRLRGAAATTDSETGARQLTDQAEAISAAWHSGPDAAAWEWLDQVTEDWPDAPDRMRQITDNVRHDLRLGESPFTPLEYRSLDQAGTLVDAVYRDEKRWRAEHLALAAEQARLDARLHSTGASADLTAAVAAAKGEAWDAVWGLYTDQWSPKRRAWEMTYAMDGANRDEEREIYLSVYDSERHRLAHPEMNEAAEVAVDMAARGARIGRLLATATPAADPTTAPSAELSPEASAATALGYQQPDPGAGHELG
ncbi:hypothetical protein [Nocardia miyunensis]|uniref:hypothetical protein n=1 Tax=Nocardia miyunensis TaxID=282684 RepID=UPI000832DC00|nr:hypothetical protein [Nocardia miyunensis]